MFYFVKLIIKLFNFLSLPFTCYKIGKNLDMSKFKIVNLLDKIFINICVFLLCFAWINFYIRDLWLTFFISLICCFAICFLLFYFVGKKQSKTKSATENKDNIEKTFLSFVLLSPNNKNILLKALFNAEKTNYKYLYKDGQNLYFDASTTNELTQQLFYEIIVQSRDIDFENLYIICPCCKLTNLSILKDKKVEIIDKNKLFKLLAETKINLKTDDLNLSASKFSFKDFALNFFAEKKAKSYFVCSLVLLFSSVILPYNFYYIIFGSMLMLFALICKILPKINNL